MHRALALAIVATAALEASRAAAEVQIVVESPRPGARVENRVDQAPIRGTASASGERPSDFDVMLVIDVSASTKTASGVDVDGDGEIGVNPKFELLPPGTYADDVLSTDPDDSIFHASSAAARALLQGVDPRRVRVGLVTFAGEAGSGRPDAWVEVPLTSDFAALQRGIDGILARGPSGATNFAEGIRLAVTELSGLPGAKSQRRAQAKPVILFLTDGVPSLPIGAPDATEPGDVEAAISSAKLAQMAGVTINTYALGPHALSYPLVVTEMARVSQGTYTPVQNPGDIIALLQGVSFANIEDVVVTNLTTGDFSTDVRLNPDGSFSGFVPVREGRNQVRVTALASDGSRGSVTIDLEFGRAALSDREMALELERIRRMNKELLLLRERQRIEEFRAREKKELELEVEKSP